MNIPTLNRCALHFFVDFEHDGQVGLLSGDEMFVLLAFSPSPPD